ncbi:expressed unknown protein [Seminavis robusta]|uniref:Uncharacterized protein n=1 Tax=Seminavis robusta TaxID=568900 RepID=A0A9N8EEY4_9STRA|nr:expressed unknown protein [Seminavis robusta]|eukprot:Sro979_g227210.1 n/a (670) ;mRNA; f:7525-9534
MRCKSMLSLAALMAFFFPRVLGQEIPLWRHRFPDADYGTNLYRATNATEKGGWATHIYSQLQAFSPNDDFFLLIENGNYVVRRLADHELVFFGDEWNAPRWYPRRNASIIHYDSNADTAVRVLLTDVETTEITTWFNFPTQYETVLNNPSFDEVSMDARWIAGAVLQNDGTTVIFSLDLVNNALAVELGVESYLYQSGVCQRDPIYGVIHPDWIGVSPLGNYLMVQWPRDGTTRCSGLESYNISSGEYLGHAYEGHQHGDLGVSDDGLEFFMTTTFASPEDNNLPGLVIHTLPGLISAEESVPFVFLRTIPWGDGWHISCRGPPGICAVSTSETIDDSYHKEVYLQFINGTTIHLAKHQSSECGYWVQPRASISRDGEYVVFASDWAAETAVNSCPGSSGYGDGEAFIIETNLSASLMELPSIDDLIVPGDGPGLASLESIPIEAKANNSAVVAATGDGAIRFQASFDSLESILSLGAVTNLNELDFVTGREGDANCARFQGSSSVSFPIVTTSADGTRHHNIDLNQGSLSFWYKPSYASGEDDVTHCLLLVGAMYDPPSMAIAEADALKLRFTDANWESVSVQGAWRAPLWSSNEWVLIEALWDTSETPGTTNLAIFVNGAQIADVTGAAELNLGPVEDLGFIRVGACDEAGTFSANGLIQNLMIRSR